MAKIRNVALMALTAAGLEFEPGKAVEVPADVARALLTNPNFEPAKAPRPPDTTQPATAGTED